MPAMLSFILECVISTSGNNALFALRNRVNMSAIGSLILPARFGYTWDQPVQRAFTEGQTRAGKFADVGVAAAAHRAAVHQAGGARVARQLRQRGVVLFLLQFGAERGVFLHRLSFALVALQP